MSITVVSGDTLSTIATTAGLSLDDLLALPGNAGFLSNPDLIFPGQIVATGGAVAVKDKLPSVAVIDGLSVDEFGIPLTWLREDFPPFQGFAPSKTRFDLSGLSEADRATVLSQPPIFRGDGTQVLGPFEPTDNVGSLAPHYDGGVLVGPPVGFTLAGEWDFRRGFDGILRSLGETLEIARDGAKEFAGGAGDVVESVTSVFDAIPLTLWILIIGLGIVLVTGFNSGGLSANVRA